MAKDKLFRVCIAGGYKKSDVNRYVDKLEEELTKLDNIKETAEALKETVDAYVAEGKSLAEAAMQDEISKGTYKPTEKEFVPAGMTRADFDILCLKAKKYDEGLEIIEKLKDDGSADIDEELSARIIQLAPKILEETWNKAEQIMYEVEKECNDMRNEAKTALLKEINSSAGKIMEEFAFIQGCIEILEETLPDRLEKRMIEYRAEAQRKGLNAEA